MVIFLSVEKITWGTLVSVAGELNAGFIIAAAKILPFFFPILRIDALGKLRDNNSFLPYQVSQKVKPKWSWQLTFIHLHSIKRNSRLLISCSSLQREKVWKIKILECHKNVRFESDLPTNSSLPLKEIIHLSSHLATKKKAARFPGARQPATPFKILASVCSDLRAKGAALSSAHSERKNIRPLH